MKYAIWSTAGLYMGSYEGDTEDEALDAMARHAGYKNQAQAEEVTGEVFTGLVETDQPIIQSQYDDWGRDCRGNSKPQNGEE